MQSTKTSKPALRLGGPTHVTFHELLRRASLITGIPVGDLVGSRGRGTQHVATVRMVLYYVLRQLGATYMQIGAWFMRNHSTIMHGCNTIENLGNDKRVRQLVSELTTDLNP